MPSTERHDTWTPAHFKNVCSALDQLPSDLDFDVPPLSEATGLSEDLGNLIQSDARSTSLLGEQETQSSNADRKALLQPLHLQGRE